MREHRLGGGERLADGLEGGEEACALARGEGATLPRLDAVLDEVLDLGVGHGEIEAAPKA
jgi:hypothetical protein